MEIHLKIIGILLIMLASIHVLFPKYFNWKIELSSLTMINRQLMYIHSFFIAFIILLIGILCLTSAKELIGTSLGKKISLGLGVFWATRLLIQFFGYSAKLWRGKAFETSVHIFFSMFWCYMTTVFLLIFLA
ncbi:MAG TPA: hypothetical protein VGQ04_21230 [Chitinophagaceae bacterium]|nr:hypothetical protein [Chitinophagaceae bacterium]